MILTSVRPVISVELMPLIRIFYPAATEVAKALPCGTTRSEVTPAGCPKGHAIRRSNRARAHPPRPQGESGNRLLILISVWLSR